MFLRVTLLKRDCPMQDLKIYTDGWFTLLYSLTVCSGDIFLKKTMKMKKKQ